MTEADAIDLIRETRSLVFTTRDFHALANVSMTSASHMLRRLAAKKRITRLYQGLWADTKNPDFNAYRAVPFLTRPHPAAVSLLTALHLHGMIEQIPQVIYVVTTVPTRRIKTPVGDFSLHQISPEFFDGYEEYKGDGGFLIATPEKALVDCIYLASRKGRRFASLPELTLPKGFLHRKAYEWVKRIPYERLQKAVMEKLQRLGLTGL
jgi:predicted transcriptional regulator of viral defense system